MKEYLEEDLKYLSSQIDELKKEIEILKWRVDRREKKTIELENEINNIKMKMWMNEVFRDDNPN